MNVAWHIVLQKFLKYILQKKNTLAQINFYYANYIFNKYQQILTTYEWPKLREEDGKIT